MRSMLHRQPIWVFDPLNKAAIGRAACCDVVNRGVAVWKGKVYVASTNAQLFAWDARTGAKIWEVDTLRGRARGVFQHRGATDCGSARRHRHAGGDMNGGGTRGFITAYDLETGKQAWRFYTVPSATDTGSSPECNAQQRPGTPGSRPRSDEEATSGHLWPMTVSSSALCGHRQSGTLQAF